MPRMLAATLLLALCACLFLAAEPHAAEKPKAWSLGTIKLPDPPQHPLLAATPEELARVRAAYKSDKPERKPVAAWVEKAGKAMAAKLEFPPRGGQHNQWYQCEKCQMGLVAAEAGHQCPKCKKVYTGAPYDDVIFAKEHGRNLSRALACAWAYAITEDAKYAKYAKDAAAVLLGYAERYEKYPYHDNACRTGEKASASGGHLSEQTLGEASDMARYIAPAYDLVWPALSDAERKQIRDGLIVPMLKNIDNHKAGKSNWQTWHNAAMLTGGIALDEVSWVKKALTQGGNGFDSQMQESVTADGMWYENSWGYHFYTLSALVEIAEGARRIGLDVWSHSNFKKMFTLPAQYAMADGSLPRFGDDVNSSARGDSRMEAAYRAYQDPAILALLSPEPSWDSVLQGRDVNAKAPDVVLASGIFPFAGHAILRGGEPAGLTAAFTFGPFGGFHGHFDKLSFVSAAFNEELGYDPGRAKSQAYRLPIHANWYRATLAHNTVVVDRQSQEGAEGEFLGDTTGKDAYAQIAGARCTKAYKGVAHTRWLAAAPTYLLVFDDLESKDEHAYDWWYHNRGTVAVCEAATRDGGYEKGYAGTEYVQREKSGSSDDLLRVRFDGPKVTNHLTMNAEKSTGVIVGDGVGTSVEDRVPLAVVRRSGKTARFAAVLEPVKTGETPAVTDVSWKEEGETFVVTVKRGTSTDRYIIPRPAKADGKAVVRVEVDGKQVQPEK
ncbi:MAG: heparinase II/III family protein [Planctomycetes bacterium]|nr:heparinase II/III family protein [Planctomycetota bacterium]